MDDTETMTAPTTPAKKPRPGSDYTRHCPGGWNGGPMKYGAAMGRRSYHAPDPKSWEGKLYVSRVQLNGDYDVNGTYFGGGEGTLPLYWVRDADSDIDYVIRAHDRRWAVGHVMRHYPKAKIAKPLSKDDLVWLEGVLGPVPT